MRPPTDATELLRDLIAIPSVNPDGEPGTDQTGEKACGEYVAEFLKLCGAEVTSEEVLPDRPNVTGRFPESQIGGPRLLFGPHLDTVGIGGMTIDPFGAEVKDGRIWGRGASDTKGSMAAMLWALYELREELPNLAATPMFVGFMSEESEQYGSQHFAAHHGAEVDFALIGEPTEMQVVYTHKACWWLDIELKGKAAHSSAPELGDSAILKAMELIQALEREMPQRLAAFENPTLGLPTFSVNMIRGGSRPNIIPDSCSIVLDIRATPELFKRGIDQFVQQVLGECGFGDATMSIRGHSPTLDTDPTHPVIKQLQAQGAGLTGAPWFCDAGWLAVKDIAAVAIGPGNIAQAHTKDEWIKIEDLEAGARFFRDFLRSYAK